MTLAGTSDTLVLDEVLALAAEQECTLVLHRAHGVFTAQVGFTLGVSGTLVEALQLVRRELTRPGLSTVPVTRPRLSVVRDAGAGR